MILSKEVPNSSTNVTERGFSCKSKGPKFRLCKYCLGSCSLSDKIKLWNELEICSQGVEYTLIVDTALDKCLRLFLFVGLGNTLIVYQGQKQEGTDARIGLVT